MSVAAFKSKCLAVMDEVATKRESVVITKHGKPIARLDPVKAQTPEDIYCFVKGKGKVIGNVVLPALDEWR